MNTINEIRTIVIRPDSTHVSSGEKNGATLSVNQRVDINNDGKVDYVVHQATRTITFAKEFMTARPQMCSVLAKSFKMISQVRPGLDRDQRDFDASKRFALGVFDEFKTALRGGESRREGNSLTFRGGDGVVRSARNFETKAGRLTSLTIAGSDGREVRIEDPKMLQAVQGGIAALPGGMLMAKRTDR